MAIPEVDLNKEVSSILSTGLKPMIVQGIVLRLLMALFARPENLNNPVLREYKWDNDYRQTKISILPVYKWNISNLQMRPALVIKRNEWRTRKLGLGDGYHTSNDFDTSDPKKWPLGHPTCATATEGSTTIFVVSREAAEVELLATEIFTHLVQYAPLIKQEFGFGQIRVAEIGSISKVEEAEEHYGVPITLAYAAIDEWKIVHESPLFKGLLIQKNLI